MKIHNVKQGSEEWLELRKSYFSASEAAAMLGFSKYMTRDQLLDAKVFGIEQEVTPMMQKIFNDGHAAESQRRELLEIDTLADWTQDVVSSEIDGLPLLASLDGNQGGGFSVIFEHKIYNKNLADYIIKNNDLPDTHWPQVEQQLLVSGAKCCVFITSNGTRDNEQFVEYKSKPERAKKLIDGWKQFKRDMQTHKLIDKNEKLMTDETKGLPALTYKTQGTSVISNATNMLAQVKLLADDETTKELVTDQDFADKDRFNKDVKKCRDRCKQVLADVKAEFFSLNDFEKTCLEIDGVLQKMQSAGEKQVKTEKEARKQAVINDANANILDFLDEQNARLCTDYSLSDIDVMLNFANTIKGLKTIDSIKSKISDNIADIKIYITNTFLDIERNLKLFEDVDAGNMFLFNDLKVLCLMPDGLSDVVNSRLSDYRDKLKADVARAEQAKIEQAKAEQAKAEQAKAKVEQSNTQTAATNSGMTHHDELIKISEYITRLLQQKRYGDAHESTLLLLSELG